MKQFTITWKHYEMQGRTCERCGKTGETIRQVVSELKPELAKRDIDLVYQEEKLKKDALDLSNLILFNGTPIENFLPDTEVQYTPCDSCSCMVEEDVSCRAIVHHGNISEDVSREILIEAIRQATKTLV